VQCKMVRHKLGSDTFFVKSALGISAFSRDPQGNVTGYTCRLADGREIRFKKIKEPASGN
jgi:hypothetical protein